MPVSKPARATRGSRNGPSTPAAASRAATTIRQPKRDGTPSAAAPKTIAQPPAPEPVHEVDRLPMTGFDRGMIGGGLVVGALVLVTQLIAIWPAVIDASSTDTPPPPIRTAPILFGIWTPTFDRDVVLLLMVLIVGAAAALIGVSRRFLHFSLRDELTKRDAWSYVLRPFQGAILALIVYFTLRGGFLGQDATAPVNPYGVAAISGLVGLFTRHAVSKLTDVFDTVFGKPREEIEEVKVRPGSSPEE